LERFIFYFRKKTLKIIESSSTKELAYSPFYHSEMQRIENSESKSPFHFDLFINQTRMKQYNLKSTQGHDVVLSERQLECLYQLTKGRTAKEIAQKLGVSFRTIQTHLNVVKEKMGVHSRSAALECLSKESIHYLEASFKSVAA
jgi:DNA-binding NarL/FixJ family response regulator